MATVAQQGGVYLAIVFATAPARHIALIGARALQGTGDTRTPMYINISSNVINIALSAVLGLGLLGAPRLEVVGVGIATAVGNTVTAGAFVLVIASDRTAAGFVRPRRLLIARQLLVVSAPKIAEGLVATVIEFPFNAVLLSLGAEVNAAYQIGRRVYQQVTSPLSRGLTTGASIVVGQSLGEGRADDARFDGWATAALGLVTVGTLGLVLAALAGPIAGLFTDDPATLPTATAFAFTYGVTAPFTALYLSLAGALQGGSDTRTPFIARTTGLLVFYLGFSTVTGLYLGWGVLGVALGIYLYYVSAFCIVAVGFQYGDWASRAAELMAERGSSPTDD